MKNQNGVEQSYFEENLSLIQRDLSNYKPDELARALIRLACVADSSVISEDEFSGLSGNSKRIKFDANDKSTWPSDTERVLCVANVSHPAWQSEICLCCFNSYDVSFDDGRSERDVIYWQPL
ncbi:MAG: hypothetical protein IBX55_12960 [Methyloprofundus sp.]|nr:hypothetical protein [Methyloprofundus sp.]